MACKEITITTDVFVSMVGILSAVVQLELEKSGRPEEHNIVGRHTVASIREAFGVALPDEWDALIEAAEKQIAWKSSEPH